MRELAACYAGQRLWWRARFAKDSIPPGGGTRVFLLEGVRSTSGVEVMDHAWVKMPGELAPVVPRRGTLVTFSAVVRQYKRNNGTCDWGLFDIEDFTHGRQR